MQETLTRSSVLTSRDIFTFKIFLPHDRPSGPWSFDFPSTAIRCCEVAIKVRVRLRKINECTK